jgi:hypothetical protein
LAAGGSADTLFCLKVQPHSVQGKIMPRFYFHLSTAGRTFQDNVGSDTSDLVDAHSKALRLAQRVTACRIFVDGAPILGSGA